MDKIFTILKKRLPVVLVFFGIFLFTANGVIGQTVSDDHDLDISAVVPGANNGGGSNPPQVATVTLSGFSFPNAKLTLLRDGAITTTLFANAGGTFQITINNLNYGNYQFSIYAEDSRGVISNPHTINVAAFSSTPYLFSGIVIPPTISSDAILVELGKQYNISGYVAPGAQVTLEIPGSNQLGTSTANAAGLYTITVRATLPPGIYSLRTRARLNGVDSLFSRPVQVLYFQGQTPGQPEPPEPPQPPAPIGLCVDYNRDRRVNLIDFSILLFWFDNQNPPARIDCNSDNRIDIKDFSLLMYYWTG